MAENYVPEDKSESGQGGLKSTEPVEGYFNLYVQRAKNVYTRPYLSRFNQSDINEVNSEARNNSAVGGYVLVERIVRDKYAKRPVHEQLVQQQVQSDEKANKQIESKELSKGGAPNAASTQEWEGAWKDKQIEEKLKNSSPKDSTHPEPLLVDKISSLPPGSPRRNCYENIKGVVENSTANIGSGTDAITRESYKELQMIVKASPMLESGVNQVGKSPVSAPGKEDLIGPENGKITTNLQSWEATLTNAVKPISDAIGSHADSNSSINKGPMGTDQMLPQAATAQAQAITPAMVSDVENSFKVTQKGALLQTPAKDFGSLKQLMTCSVPSLSVPFDLVSDVYNGLMNLIKQVSKLLDTVMAQITQFAISAIGGLVDGLFPAGMLQKLIAVVSKIAGQIGALFELLGGFAALKKISQQISASLPLGCTANIFESQSTAQSKSIKTNNLANIAGKVATVARTVEAVGAVVGSLPELGKGFGNLGVMIGGAGIPKDLGKLTANISNPQHLMTSMFDEKINGLLKNLPFCCAVGCTGDNGFSIGEAFDSLRDGSFTKAMASWSAHASIISPNFNKKSTSVGSFAAKDVIPSFDKLPFGTNAEGAKGVIMYAAGATAKRKVFKL
jgi:hypothetical protein